MSMKEYSVTLTRLQWERVLNAIEDDRLYWLGSFTETGLQVAKGVYSDLQKVTDIINEMEW